MKSNKAKVNSPKDIVNEITAIAAEATRGCYGVSEIAFVEEKKGKEERIVVKMHSDKTVDIEIHVIMAASVKITETLFECQKVVKYRVERRFPKVCRTVNVYADAISSK